MTGILAQIKAVVQSQSLYVCGGVKIITFNKYLYKFWGRTWEVSVKQLCCVLKYNNCLEEKYLGNHLNYETKSVLFSRNIIFT
jgi:hypothetical protein